jgi:hypothetical protein
VGKWISRELIKLTVMTMTTSIETQRQQYFPTHYEEDSNDYISMISRKPTQSKIDNTIVPGSLDVRINRKLFGVKIGKKNR